MDSVPQVIESFKQIPKRFKSSGEDIMATATNKKTAAVKKTTAKKVAAPVVTETKADLAMEIVIRNFTNKVEGVSTRQRVLAELEKIGLTAPTARQTYFNNTLVKLRNQDAEAVAKALENNKPVWSVVKVDSKNLATAVGLFASATKAREFNETYEHHAVIKGVVEPGDLVDAKLIKKVAKAPRQPKAAVVPVKKAAVKAKVATKKAAVAKKTGKASTKKAA